MKVMTDKEFRRLKRAELIEIIYRLQKNEEELKAENETLQKQLEDRSTRIQEAGSIAEAVLSLNGIFEAAQKAADDYLREIHTMNEETEQKIAKAKKQATEIIEAAEKQSREIKEKTDIEIENKWDGFAKKAKEMLLLHTQLNQMIDGDPSAAEGQTIEKNCRKGNSTSK